MFDFQQKRKLRAVTSSRFIWLFLLLLSGLVLFSAYNRYQIAQDMANRRAVAEAEVAALEQRKEELKTEVDYLSNERGIEAEMRRQFDVAREGEQVVIIVPPDNLEPEVLPLSSTTPSQKRPWYRFW